MRKILILGGGYAGLAALVALRERWREAEIVLVDPADCHVHRTRLHERIRRPETRSHLPFKVIERRFRCRHVKAKAAIECQDLARCQADGALTCGELRIPFDFLIIATGSSSPLASDLAEALVPDALATWDWEDMVKQRLADKKGQTCWISVIGAGASGIQILFELDTWRRLWRRSTGQEVRLRLIFADSLILPAFPRQIQEYAVQKLIEAGIECFGQTVVSACRDCRIDLYHQATGQTASLPSDLTFACLGLRPNPRELRTNAFGQVIENGQVLERVFAAGDCARFESHGANSYSAQVAIRKGRLVGENLYRYQLGLQLKPYTYQEQGYFISMGPADGAGWLGRPENVVTGLPAFFIKEAVETWYDLSIL
jgi:NADH dehydrogenase